MSAECYPITILPHVSALYRDYLAMGESAPGAQVRDWFGSEPFGRSWMGGAVAGGGDGAALAAALKLQSESFGASAAMMSNIDRLREGARAVVTGQQVGLLGGPLLTLLKAATAIARAREATRVTGTVHVPVFWLATEDHDLAEVDQVSLLKKMGVETLRAGLTRAAASPVGDVPLGGEVEEVLEKAAELLGWAPGERTAATVLRATGGLRADAGRGRSLGFSLLSLRSRD